MTRVFALVDCNNFYVSCEKVFNPKLEKRPVIVLSNNDGCVVARSNEAKTIGIKFGIPLFKIQNLIKKYNVKIFSSNYALYADMSQRVMQTLSMFAPDIEIYSIDEAFLDLSNFTKINLNEYGHTIKSTVEKWIGIPVSIGIATSKTLAKLASKLAKISTKTHGVVNLTTSSSYSEKALKMTDINDVWGIGPSYSKFLNTNGIYNALQLKNANRNLIKSKMGVVGTRLLKELSGYPCYSIEQYPSPKKGITVSRSFKNEIKSLDDLRQAISSFASRGGEKLRSQRSVANILMLFIMTNRFKNDNFYIGCEKIRLTPATNNSSELIKSALKVLEKIYRKDCKYKKAGIMFNELTPESMTQLSLFDYKNQDRKKKLMQTLDKINKKFGSNSLKYASVGLSQNQKWETAFNMKSQSYTTNWDQLLQIP